MRQEGVDQMGVMPVVFTETGIPFDLSNKAAYGSGNYHDQVQALDAVHYAIEGSKSQGYTLWTYTVSVSNYLNKRSTLLTCPRTTISGVIGGMGKISLFSLQRTYHWRQGPPNMEISLETPTLLHFPRVSAQILLWKRHSL
jgi:hypothetical protein